MKKCAFCDDTGRRIVNGYEVYLSLVYIAEGLPGGGRYACRVCLDRRDALLAAQTPPTAA